MRGSWTAVPLFNNSSNGHFNRPVKTILDLDGDGVFEETGDDVDMNGNATGLDDQGFADAMDIATRTEYDLAGNAVTEIDARGNATDKDYDRANRLRYVTGPEVADAEAAGAMTRPVTETVYDHNSNVTHVIDPRGVMTLTEYDELNRPTHVTTALDTPDEVTTETQYDENGNVKKLILNPDITDPADYQKQQTVYDYDAFDRQVTETLPGGRVTSTAYYRNGNVLSVTDPKGQVVTSDYDRADRVVETVHSRADSSIEETRTFDYDKVGNVLLAGDAAGATGYLYDNLYRVTHETKPGYTVASAYDLNGNRTSVAYPDGRTLGSAYDAMNRLVTVDDAAEVTQYVYDKNGNRKTCTYPNGVVNSYTYDALNRVLTADTTKDGGTIYSCDYAYDLVGNRRAIDEGTRRADNTFVMRHLAYTYDERYQLTSESWEDETYAYAYDLAGNRVTGASGDTILN